MGHAQTAGRMQRASGHWLHRAPGGTGPQEADVAPDAGIAWPARARRAARLGSLAALESLDSGRSDVSERHDELVGEIPW